MKKFLPILVFILLFQFTSPTKIFAIYDPLSVANNKFGIHINFLGDLEHAASLINSSGGDWGYVTVVIKDDERDSTTWQKFFDECRARHIIPLVRIATRADTSSWKKPQESDVQSWVDFLTQLNWPIQNRYVILFNEPNHATEWGGEIRPDEYADIVMKFSTALKKASPDFFILNAGFDQAAISTSGTMDEATFLLQMKNAQPQVFDQFDGWVSHSYPNPHFMGKPEATGKMSVVGYRWEVEFLRANAGIRKLPIFITETGWPRFAADSDSTNDDPTVGEKLLQTVLKAWTDDNIVAITPFTLNFPGTPFEAFSWRKKKNDLPAAFYSQYDDWQNIKKLKGTPKQIHAFTIESFPDSLVEQDEIGIPVSIKNTGQSIWGEFINAVITINGTDIVTTNKIPFVQKIAPGHIYTFSIMIKVPAKEQAKTIALSLASGDMPYGDIQERTITIIPPPLISFSAMAGWKMKNQTFDLVVYDDDDHPRIEVGNIQTNAVGSSPDIALRGIIPTKTYRFVLKKQYYLPRQKIMKINPHKTTINFQPLLPFDADDNGKRNLNDIFQAILHPIRTISFLLPN